MSTAYATYTFPDGTHCYSGPNCQKHASQIAALSAANSITGPESFERALQAEVPAPVVPLAKGLKPREIPNGEPRKFSDLLRSGDKGSRVVTSVDLSTPPGYFVASVKMLGITTEYLIDGTEGDLHAPIAGRIELYKSRGSVYRGSELKGGKYLGQIGGASNKTFSDAFDDIAEGEPPPPTAPESTPGAMGQPALVGIEGDAASFTHRERNYNVNSYSDHRGVSVKQVSTRGEFQKAIQQVRSLPGTQIRVVEVNFDSRKKNGFFGMENSIVRGPSDGTPLVIDYVSGYTNLEVVEGNVVINATSTYGGGVKVREGASATIITPAGKFSIDADAGSAVTVFPRSGARGGVWSDQGANVKIDDLYGHNIENHVRKER